MGWDGYLKWEILFEIRKELKKNEELYQAANDEVWLTEKQLVEEFPFFKKSWVKHKYYKLCYRQVIVTDKDGNEHASKRFYPRNAILQKLRESTITDGDLGYNIHKYRMNGGEVEVGGFDLFSKEWQKGLSIDELVYHL